MAAALALVVDDSPLILMHAAEILEDAGFHTLTRLSAEDALTVLEVHGGDLLLLFTDVEMTGPMDGYGLARATAERWPHIGILVASATRPPQEGDMPPGAVFVPKPFSAEVVHDRLKAIVPEEHRPEGSK